MATSMLHRRLIGLSPRSLGSWTKMFPRHHMTTSAVNQDLLTNGKKAKVAATLTLYGFDASDLKPLLPLVQRHFTASLVEARKVVHNQLSSEEEATEAELSEEEKEVVRKDLAIGCSIQVTLDDFKDDPDLCSWSEKHLNISDIEEEPKDTQNVKRTWGRYTKTLIQ